MIRKLDYKVEGGKLLRVEVEIEGGFARRVLIRGDFFAHPEELFEEAEEGLAGIRLSELPEFARRSFSNPDLSLHGLSPEAIATALAKVLDETTLS